MKNKLPTWQQNITSAILNEINEWPQSDATFDDALENNFANQELTTLGSGFKLQVAWWFKRSQVTSTYHAASLGIGLCSDARYNLLIDEDA